MILKKDEHELKKIDDTTFRSLLPYTENLMGAKILFTSVTNNVELHRHPEEQLTYILKGKFKFFINQEEYLVEAGDALLFESNVLHGCLVLEEGSELLDIFNPMRKDFISNEKDD